MPSSQRPPPHDLAEPANYGGQAVIEGVMMRSRERLAIAVRRPDGGIEVRSEPTARFYRSRWARLPFVRGLLTLSDALVIGMRALTFSADVAAGDEVELGGPLMWGTMVASLVVAVGLFFALPALVTSLVDRCIQSAWVSNLVEGLIRLLLFLSYLAAISRIPDIQRVFAYHGAEHKVINAYEDGQPLTLEGARGQSIAHARCGTGFLLIVVIVSILVFGFLGRPPLPLRLLTRLFFIPVIAAISYELVRLASRHRSHPLAQAVVAPSRLLQGLTAREPADDMVEVALAAFQRVLTPQPEPGAAVPQTSAALTGSS
mgnify:CR=1 FL=1